MYLPSPILAVLAVLAATTSASLITPDLNITELSALLAGAGPVIPQAMATTKPLAVLPSSTHLYPWDISTHFITRTRAAKTRRTSSPSSTTATTTATTIPSKEQLVPTPRHFHHGCQGYLHLPPSPPFKFHHGPHCPPMTKRHRSITATDTAGAPAGGAAPLLPRAAEVTPVPAPALAQPLIIGNGEELSSQTTTITTTTTAQVF